ncbi:MAG: ECF transporter S component [Chloroflexota bacterium]
MAHREGTEHTKAENSPWVVGKREVIYTAIGAVLYGLSGWVTAGLQIPGQFNSSIRPGIAIPLFFGAVFGPVVGFFTGFIGNIITDLLSGDGFSWNWSLGNGLMSLIAGLAVFYVNRLNNPRSIALAVGFALVGIIIGMGFSAYTDIWVSSISLEEAWVEFYPVVISNSIAAIILIPLLGVAYENVRTQTGQ